MSHEQPTTRPRFLDRIKAPDFQAIAAQGCFVYCYLRKETGTPYYVGIASKACRPLVRHDSAHVPRDRSRIRVLRSGLTWEIACQWECRYIARYGRKDIGVGILLNMTDGGDGLKNPSPEVRARMSAARKGKPSPISKDGRKRIADAVRSRVVSEDTRRKISIAKKGRKNGPLSAEHRRKIGEAHLGQKRSEETRKKMSDRAKERNARSEYKQQQSQRFKGKKLSAEHVQKLRDSHKGYVPTAEARKNMSEAQKRRAPVDAVGKQKISNGKMARGAAQLGMSLEEYKAMTPWARMNLRRARGLPPLRSDASR